MNDWITIVSNLGFPIVIALYILIRLENTLKENTKVIQNLILHIDRNLIK
jgi:hypothetical protein|tara:strand:+ start:3119 stop:3268 length:150 start_codon:yes stop_codon:yes gene_type:complete